MQDLIFALLTIGIIIVPLVFAAKCPPYKASASGGNLPVRMNLQTLRPGPDRRYLPARRTNIQSRDEI
jgi:hypothetical protein